MTIKKGQMWLNRFHNLIEENLVKSELNNKDIALQLGISERQLYRKLKQLSGQTPNEYIRHYRLKIAKRYLETGTYFTVKEVSHAVGYSNVWYFQQQFEQLFQKRPFLILKEFGWR